MQQQAESVLASPPQAPGLLEEQALLFSLSVTASNLHTGVSHSFLPDTGLPLSSLAPQVEPRGVLGLLLQFPSIPSKQHPFRQVQCLEPVGWGLLSEPHLSWLGALPALQFLPQHRKWFCPASSPALTFFDF